MAENYNQQNDVFLRNVGGQQIRMNPDAIVVGESFYMLGLASNTPKSRLNQLKNAVLANQQAYKELQDAFCTGLVQNSVQAEVQKGSLVILNNLSRRKEWSNKAIIKRFDAIYKTYTLVLFIGTKFYDLTTYIKLDYNLMYQLKAMLGEDVSKRIKFYNIKDGCFHDFEELSLGGLRITKFSEDTIGLVR